MTDPRDELFYLFIYLFIYYFYFAPLWGGVGGGGAQLKLTDA